MRQVFGTSAEIESSLKTAGVRAVDAKALAARAKPYVWLFTALVDDEAEIPLGATKIGGSPDLSVTMTWPWRPPYPDHEQRIAEIRAHADNMNGEDLAAIQAETLEEFRKLLPPDQFEGLPEAFAKVDLSQFNLDGIAEGTQRTSEPAPLAFIAQVDLVEVWRAGPVDPDIPREGRLLLFYDIDQRPGGYKPTDTTGARLIYDLTSAEGLRRVEPPSELAELIEEATLPAQSCVLIGAISPPFYGSPDWDACSLREMSDETVRNWWSDITADGHDHRIGGHPLQIQGDMQTTCALVSNGLDLGDGTAWKSKAAQRLKPDAVNWVLLMQIASDEEADMMWGDVGNLYVWIHRDALRARRFEEARVILQCY
jgi:uncharacterized protein YwqG